MGIINPDAEIELLDRKVSGTRTTTFAMRLSRVHIEKGMTPWMMDAEREIAEAWQIRTGHMGYGSPDLNRVRGVSERDEDKERLVVIRLVAWMDACPREERETVLALATGGKTMAEVAAEWRVSTKTVGRRWHAGLIEYCRQQGWPTQTKSEAQKSLPRTP